MKKWKQSLLHMQEDGMEAIEGLLVITLTLFVLFFIWAYGFLLYQNWAVQYVATDTASRIAQTYAYPYADPFCKQFDSGRAQSVQILRQERY